MDNADSPCKGRFKGIENFLRRLSYNLGNSPSQTEVKIISCIPIDVTDLQEKIICLERQLEKERKKGDKRSQESEDTDCICTSGTNKNKVVFETGFADIDSHAPFTNSVHQRRSALSFMSSKSTLATKGTSESNVIKPMAAEHIKDVKKKHKTLDSHSIHFSKNNATTKINQHMNHAHDKALGGSENIKNKLKRHPEYFTNLVEKQYELEIMPTDSRIESQFSSPFCRDSRPHNYDPCFRDISSCSCLSGDFFNTDYNMSYGNNISLVQLNHARQHDKYVYIDDSSLYDLVPVKEKSNEQAIINNAQPGMRSHSETVDADYEVITSPFEIPYKGNRKFIKTQRNVCESTNQKSEIDYFPDTHEKQPNFLNPTKPKSKTEICNAPVTNKTNVKNNTHATSIRKPSDRTYVTVNQIKTILQSVLKEVKENSQINTTRHRKDVILQAGISQINTQTSQLPNGFPCNSLMYPCLGHGVPNQLCYPILTTPYPRYYQNYPLLVTPNYIESCKEQTTKNTVATNTDKIETEKSEFTIPNEVIDIYKSSENHFALNDKSDENENQEPLLANHNDNKEGIKHETLESIDIFITLPRVVSNDKAGGIKEDVETPKAAVVPNVISVGTNVSKSSVKCGGEDDVTLFTIKKEIEIQTESEENQWRDEVETYTQDFDSHVMTTSKRTDGVLKTKEKNGFFSKVKKLITKIFRKTEKEIVTVKEIRDSDVYAGVHMKSSHSIVVYSMQKKAKQKTIITPYLEQEYKKLWYESFHKNKICKRSSESVQVGR